MNRVYAVGMRQCRSFAAVVLLTGCPKKTATTVAGTDDEQMDQLTAQLEELRAKVKAEDPKCPEWCNLSKRVCELSARTCEISGRNPDRMEMQQKCTQSQEDCAAFNDGCARCG